MTPTGDGPGTEQCLTWIEAVLPRAVVRLLDADGAGGPLAHLPLAQLRLVLALGGETDDGHTLAEGETMGRLSERLGVRGNALTQAADRLQQHGLAERVGDPRDGRLVRLRLTADGRALVEERRARRRAHLRELWEQLSDDEHDALLRAVRVLEEVAGRFAEAPERPPKPPGPKPKPPKPRRPVSPGKPRPEPPRTEGRTSRHGQ